MYSVRAIAHIRRVIGEETKEWTCLCLEFLAHRFFLVCFDKQVRRVQVLNHKLPALRPLAVHLQQNLLDRRVAAGDSANGFAFGSRTLTK